MKQKECLKCKQTKSIDEFNTKGKNCKGSDRHHPYCKPCLYRYQMNRWTQRKKKAVEHKGGKCEKCGYNKNYAALGFHHRDPSEKDFQWDKLRLRTWVSILEELDKCDLVCANCHMEMHYPQQFF